MDIKALPEKSLNTFCAIFDFAKGEADITCPASTYPTACLRACERRGLIVWDTERVKGKTKRWCALTKLGAYYGCEGLALVPEATKASRNRQWVKVQFDLDNPEYVTAYRLAGELARKRLLAPTMRDWLLIHAEFADKDNTTFAKAYPAMYKLMTETRQEDLIGKLEALLQNARIPANIGANFDLLADDDTVVIDVQKDANSGKRASENFLKSVLALNPQPAIPQAGNPRVLVTKPIAMPDFEED